MPEKKKKKNVKNNVVSTYTRRKKKAVRFVLLFTEKVSDSICFSFISSRVRTIFSSVFSVSRGKKGKQKN